MSCNIVASPPRTQGDGRRAAAKDRRYGWIDAHLLQGGVVAETVRAWRLLRSHSLKAGYCVRGDARNKRACSLVGQNVDNEHIVHIEYIPK